MLYKRFCWLVGSDSILSRKVVQLWVSASPYVSVGERVGVNTPYKASGAGSQMVLLSMMALLKPNSRVVA